MCHWPTWQAVKCVMERLSVESPRFLPFFFFVTPSAILLLFFDCFHENFKEFCKFQHTLLLFLLLSLLVIIVTVVFLFVCFWSFSVIGMVCEKTPQWQQKFHFRCIRWPRSSDNLWIFELKLQELCCYLSKCQTSCMAQSPHSCFRHWSRHLPIIFSQFTICTISLVFRCTWQIKAHSNYIHNIHVNRVCVLRIITSRRRQRGRRNLGKTSTSSPVEHPQPPSFSPSHMWPPSNCFRFSVKFPEGDLWPSTPWK